MSVAPIPKGFTSSDRPTVGQEGALWRAAYLHFGASGLYHLVLELFGNLDSKPGRSAIEHLSEESVGREVVTLLKSAFAAAHVEVPDAKNTPTRVSTFSRCSQHLAQGLIKAMPLSVLPMDLRGYRLEDDLGL